MSGKPIGMWPHAYVITRTLRRFVARPVARFKIIDVTVTGEQYLPETGGNIGAGNHPHPWDAALMFSVFDRNVVFIAKAELWRWRNPLLRSLLIIMGQIPVKRGDRASGAKAQASALRVLTYGQRRKKPSNKGGTAVIFPEGGCTPPTGEMRPFKGGVYFLAKASGAPVIPFGSEGSANIGLARIWHMFRKEQRQHVTVNFGPPMFAKDFEREDEHESEAAFLAELRRRIELLRRQPWPTGQATA